VKAINKKDLGLSITKKLVMIVMGSLGSMTINNELLKIVPKFNSKEYEVLLVTGNNYYDKFKEINAPSNVKIVPFSYLDHFFTAEYVSLKYSSDLIHGLYNMQTVTNFCINIAQYMGFKEIYLLGVDFSYSSKDKQQHFDGTRNVLMDDDIIRQSVVFNTRRSYELVKRETEKAGVKVFNATRGGKLEVFERIDFDKLNLK